MLELMKRQMVSTYVKANGTLQLPTSVRKLLHLRNRGGDLLGFVIDGSRVLLTKATVVPEPQLSDEEIAELARLSKQGRGRRAFRDQDTALQYLWSL